MNGFGCPHRNLRIRRLGVRVPPSAPSFPQADTLTTLALIVIAIIWSYLTLPALPAALSWRSAWFLDADLVIDEHPRLAVDSSGDGYVTGLTDSTHFPTVSPYQSSNSGGSYDGFVTKLDAAGSALDYSTYLGGSGDDEMYSIAVNPAGYLRQGASRGLLAAPAPVCRSGWTGSLLAGRPRRRRLG